MGIVEVNGITIFAKITGEGEPLILIHGLGLDHTIWRFQQPFFSQHFKVIAYDARGHGRSTHPPNFTLKDHAEDLRALMDRLGIEKAHIMGLSMGTYICQQFVSMYPEKAGKIILAATRGYGQTSSIQKQIEEKRNSSEPPDLDTALKIAGAACFRDGGTKEQLEIFYDSCRYNTLDSYLTAMKALAGFDFRPDLPNIKNPTLIINGDLDVLTTLEQAKEVHSLIPGAKLEIFEGCGHLCNIEEPGKFNSKVLEFLTT